MGSSRLMEAQAPQAQHLCPPELQPCPAQSPVSSSTARRPPPTLIQPWRVSPGARHGTEEGPTRG